MQEISLLDISNLNHLGYAHDYNLIGYRILGSQHFPPLPVKIVRHCLLKFSIKYKIITISRLIYPPFIY